MVYSCATRELEITSFQVVRTSRVYSSATRELEIMNFRLWCCSKTENMNWQDKFCFLILLVSMQIYRNACFVLLMEDSNRMRRKLRYVCLGFHSKFMIESVYLILSLTDVDTT
jgi:hypothetical protein